MKIKLLNVPLAFPKLFEAKAVGNGDKKYYSAAYPIDPDGRNAKLIEEAIEKAGKEKWKEKAPAILANLKKKGDRCYHEGDLTNDEGEVYQGFEGMYALNSSRQQKDGRPSLYGRDPKMGQLTEADGALYGGCFVNAVVDIWAQDNANGKRINCQLQGIQFVKDGEAFGGGGVASVDDFDELEEIDDDTSDEFA